MALQMRENLQGRRRGLRSDLGHVRDLLVRHGTDRVRRYRCNDRDISARPWSDFERCSIIEHAMGQIKLVGWSCCGSDMR